MNVSFIFNLHPSNFLDSYVVLVIQQITHIASNLVHLFQTLESSLSWLVSPILQAPSCLDTDDIFSERQNY